MDQILTVTVSALGTLFAAVITYFLIPYLKQKKAYQQNNNAISVVHQLVDSAEQIFGDKSGEQKKDYVIGLVKNLNLGIPDRLVDAFLESAVNRKNNLPVEQTDNTNAELKEDIKD